MSNILRCIGCSKPLNPNREVRQFCDDCTIKNKIRFNRHTGAYGVERQRILNSITALSGLAIGIIGILIIEAVKIVW